MNSATKVGEIFAAAGTAFSKLGELTMQLHPPNESAGGTKWTEEEIDMIHASITKFGGELDQICERIKSRTVSQIKGALKKKTYDDIGMPVSSSNALVSSPTSVGSTSSPTKISVSAGAARQKQQTSLSSPMKSSEVTLNMLNASDGDVENLNSRMDFDAATVSS